MFAFHVGGPWVTPALGSTFGFSTPVCVDHLICTDRIRQSASYEINSKWSSSTTCWEFFHHYLSDITVKLIDLQIFLLKNDHLRTDAFLRLMPSGVNGCYGINLSCSTLFYQTRKLQIWRLETLCRFSVQIVNSDQYLLKLFDNFVGVRFFEPQCYSD